MLHDAGMFTNIVESLLGFTSVNTEYSSTVMHMGACGIENLNGVVFILHIRYHHWVSKKCSCKVVSPMP